MIDIKEFSKNFDKEWDLFLDEVENLKIGQMQFICFRGKGYVDELFNYWKLGGDIKNKIIFDMEEDF